MSTGSKITFGSSCVLAVGTMLWVHSVHRTERLNLQQGPIKDAARVAAKQERRELKKTSEEAAVISRKKMLNEQEHLLQLELREKYAKLQPLDGEIVQGEMASRKD
ncbi:hypothetical protein BABINDRAFT_161629 [Babjeviella inositovora NRRL Y-12698]|uniref:Uncharacterized protein n=1 Tax=Babjeviella inositovora NRRL Y-12698 TaxID=984486 RepID=A0A1E3QR61_9ASCO|nr:uncharacterized protein BABINDRAFT_161629 [Babjeviella inositovora NRRL Y-12698]ODQ79974.1 hypothetical protein BABINDRAFT_161629 [Babjeviella inositovora NRRL Y-12698]